MPEGTTIMAAYAYSHRSPGFRLSFRGNRTGSALAVPAGVDAHTAQARALASLRILTGFVFLWAFLDKT